MRIRGRSARYDGDMLSQVEEVRLTINMLGRDEIFNRRWLIALTAFVLISEVLHWLV